MPKKKSSANPARSFEESLWDTATKLRGRVESSVPSEATSEQQANPYKHVVLASSGEPSRTNGSMLTNTTGEGAIRQKMVENDLVDCRENKIIRLAA